MNKPNEYYHFELVDFDITLYSIMKQLNNVSICYPKSFDNQSPDVFLNYTRNFFLSSNLVLSSLPYINSIFINKILTNNFNNCDEVLKICEDEVCFLNPFDMPVFLQFNSDFEYGCFQPVYIGSNDEKKQLYFCEFLISDKLSCLTPAIYAHEIVHSVLEKANTIKSFSNFEVLPLFFEKLMALNFDKNGQSLQTNQTLRLKTLANALFLIENKNLSLLKKINVSMAINSLFKSQLLFDRYLSASTNEKNKIMTFIQYIFDGNYFLEDFLNLYDIDFKNSENSFCVKKILSQ